MTDAKRHAILARDISWHRFLTGGAIFLVFIIEGSRTGRIGGFLFIGAMGATLAIALNAVPFYARRRNLRMVELRDDEYVRLRVSAELHLPRESNRRFAIFGFLYFTTARLIFHSKQRTISIPLESIISVDYHWGWLGAISVLKITTRDSALNLTVRRAKLVWQELSQ